MKSFWSFLVFVLFLLCGSLVHSKIHSNQVLAVVAGTAITYRYLQIEDVINDPSNFVLGKELDLGSSKIQRLLQQLAIRAMVADENRILKVYQIPKSDLDARYSQLKKSLGTSKLDAFLASFRVSEADIRLRLEAWITLEKTIADQDDVEAWLKRLRARHNLILYNNS